MISARDVTIIIPHLGTTPEQRYSLNMCMSSLDETVPNMQKVVVLNGTNNAEEMVNLMHLYSKPNYRLLIISEQGQCRAVNAGIATSTTDWFIISNDDMIYPPDWFLKLTEGMGNKMCISPKLVEPRPGAPTFEVYFCGGAGGDFQAGKFNDFATDYYTKQPAEYRTGFNLPFLIKKELWDTIGGYDLNFDPWGSNGDSDLEYKVRLAGVQPYQNMGAVVYHFSQTSGTFHPDNRGYWNKNWDYFIEKWGFERASSPPIWECSFEIPMDVLKFKPSWMGKYGKVNK